MNPTIIRPQPRWPLALVPITTKVVILNPTHGKVYSIQHHVIKFFPGYSGFLQYGVGSRPALEITKKNALDSQPQVIKFTSCLPMIGGSLRLIPPLKLVAMI
jgi:hypothetical protein